MDENPFTVIAVFILMSVGAACLFRGLARLREIGRLRHAPVSKIGAAPAGWAALSGVAQARREIKDPLLMSPCVWWRCVVQQRLDEGSRTWGDIKEVACSEPFFLEDGTGRITVAPREADLHVDDLEERIVELTAENHGELAPLLRQWGIKFTGFRLRLLGSLGIRAVRTLRIRVQTLQSAAPITVVGRVSRSLESAETRQGVRLVMRKRRGEPLVISTRKPSGLPRSIELRAAGRALLGLLLIGTGCTLAWLLKTWGFWPSLAIVTPVSVAAAIAGRAIAWWLETRRRGSWQ